MIEAIHFAAEDSDTRKPLYNLLVALSSKS